MSSDIRDKTNTVTPTWRVGHRYWEWLLCRTLVRRESISESLFSTRTAGDGASDFSWCHNDTFGNLWHQLQPIPKEIIGWSILWVNSDKCDMIYDAQNKAHLKDTSISFSTINQLYILALLFPSYTVSIPWKCQRKVIEWWIEQASFRALLGYLAACVFKWELISTFPKR